MKEYLVDLHTHTIACGHAYSSFEENLKVAKDKGLKVFGYSEHGPDMPGSADIQFFKGILAIPENINGIRVLKGVEANIIDYNGNIDMDDLTLKNLDYVIASCHSVIIKPSSKRINTKTLIKTIKTGKINILGHIDDGLYPLNYKKVVKVAKKYNVLIEINNSSMRVGGRKNAAENVKTIMKYCMKYNHHVIFNSDAHMSSYVGGFANCIRLKELCNFREDLIVNSDIEKLKKFISF